ncbi:DUF7351 domain-containing protein [Candidatus Halobonum tyrrellensis]|uniref:ArsR family transcriptional regulator n=1 Tax=Candidatus Halobonum tyrrellensis G22 TaxID=1324957 RepID=V4GT16_9EURY|nr:hypothetical protein [Candidatus Halobonum tyrrellensis]ESP88246.1 ArsR family transcriptional regulator [Candidatus Halobonum tyrrellensis G22]
MSRDDRAGGGGDGEGDARGFDADAGTDADPAAAADDAFAALGSETRLRTLRTLAAADEPPTFTDLFEASGEETTAGFAYHLRQLTDRYVRKGEETERYHLTYAGRQVARALAAGTYTERVDRDPEPMAGDCPVCDAAALSARVADNYVAVACTDCGRELLSLPFPPSGVRGRDADAVLDAFDAHHRTRFRLLADGVCPDCAGRARGRIEFAETPGLPGEASRPVLAGTCADCEFRVRAPVSLALVEHPAVVAFFETHGESVRDRPVWNLGPEWGETVLSREPPAVRVSVRLDDERLSLLVGDGPTVVDTERASVDGDTAEGRPDADERGPNGEPEGRSGGTKPVDANDSEGDPAGATADDYEATTAGSS